MKERDPSEAALGRLIADAREAMPPESDWDVVEASLMERARASAPVGPRLAPARTAWPLAIAALVAALGGVLLYARQRPPERALPETPSAAIAPATAPSPFVEGKDLSPGTLVVAASGAVRVEHAGHVTWTLDPGSAAHVESTGDVVGVALDWGALTAHVTKSPRPESFVVRVERTRIAVHGTAFRVMRSDGTVRVEVSEGVVSVGPVNEPGTALAAPASATLDFRGRRADAVSAAPRAAAPRTPSKGAAPEEAAPPLPEVPAVSPALRVVETVQRCLAAHTVSRGDLRVTVGTSMSLKIAPDGHVGELVFAPPLAPAVGRCVEAEVRAMRFESNPSGVTLQQHLELGR